MLYERYGLLLVGRFETTRCHSSTGTLRNQAQRTVGEASSAQQGQAERQNARTRQAILYQLVSSISRRSRCSGHIDNFEKRLRSDLAELEEIRNVWKSLENVCNRLEELKDLQWITVQPKKLKVNLEELLTSMTTMVPSVQNYHSYNAVKGNIENYLKVSELPSVRRSTTRCDPSDDSLRQRIEIGSIERPALEGHDQDSRSDRHVDQHVRHDPERNLGSGG